MQKKRTLLAVRVKCLLSMLAVRIKCLVFMKGVLTRKICHEVNCSRVCFQVSSRLMICIIVCRYPLYKPSWKLFLNSCLTPILHSSVLLITTLSSNYLSANLNLLSIYVSPASDSDHHVFLITNATREFCKTFYRTG